MNKEKLIESIKQNKKKIAIVLIALLLIGGGSIYALFNNGNSRTPKNAKQSELKKDEDKLSDDKKSTNENISTTDKEDTKKDTESNNTSLSDNDDKKSSNESSSSDKPSNGGSSSSSNSNTSKPNTPSHEHSWVEQTKQDWVAPVTKKEQYVTKEAWTEYVPIMELQARTICNACGADITGGVVGHMKEFHKGGNSGYRTEYIEVQVGTDTINHPAEYGIHTITVQEGYYKTISIGYQCSCGATK